MIQYLFVLVLACGCSDKTDGTATTEDNTTETFPPSGFYKTWSDCWLNDGEWGGDGCPEKASDDSDDISALGIMATAGAIAIAAIIRNE